MELWQILLIVGVGTVPFIVIAILVEAAVGSGERDRSDERAIVPFDLD